MTKTNRNLIVAILAVILTFSIALAGIYGLRQARADETLPNVENQETFELKVGDTILGKTLVFNPGPEIGTSIVTLSNGATLTDNFSVVLYNKDDIGGRVYVANRDNLNNTYIDITESITFIDWDEEEVVVTFTEALTVTDIDGPTVRYFITPVEEPEELPEGPEQEPEQEPVDTPTETPKETPDDDVKDDASKEDTKVDDSVASVSEDATFLDWVKDNVLVLVISVVLLAVIVTISIMIKKHRRS